MPKTVVNGDDAMEDEDDEDEDSDSDEESEDGASTTPIIQVIFLILSNHYVIHLFVSQFERVIIIMVNTFISNVFDKQVRRVAHHGCVNRIRAMPQNPHICVSWADSGHVQVRS